ncbi:NADAR family protein [Candidatus Finniella inopinata]|uniref:NADAR family protein n=1 Tax=Candidatus Finniella inopinata TaxID=1696036 RepID=A0A4Q7DLJ1_9PROT|nr:NADAR family protein [Candidatus Finniella inopinata]RZI47044.1 NADAR family protein [Candidatus Finniella inopinata]
MRKSLLILYMLFAWCGVIKPICAQSSLHQAIGRNAHGTGSITDIDPFYDSTHFYVPKSFSITDEDLQKQCGKMLLKTLTKIPEKLETLLHAGQLLQQKIYSNPKDPMLVHYLCVTAIIYLNNVFECNLYDYKNKLHFNIGLNTAKDVVGAVTNALRGTSIWADVQKQVDDFKKAYDKNAAAGKWGKVLKTGGAKGVHKITDRIDADDWLRIFGEITAERLGCLPEFFHMENDPTNGWGSNYSPHGFTAPDGTIYKTSEHYFQAHKFVKGTQAFNAVVAASDPGVAKQLATVIHNGITNKISNNWHGIGPGPIDSEGLCPFKPGVYNTQLESLTYKDRVMVRALYYKFTNPANKNIKKKLMDTYPRAFIENTSKAYPEYPDGYWGNDINDVNYAGKPINMLGLMLAALREYLKETDGVTTASSSASYSFQHSHQTSGAAAAAAAAAVADQH